MSEPRTSHEKLDLESPQHREVRLGHLFNTLSSKSPGSPAGLQPIQSKPFAVPQSDALTRAKEFLPRLASSNAELLARAVADPDGVDIERTNGEEQVIAMDLGLGVFDAVGVEGLGPVVEGRTKKRRRLNGEDAKRSEDSDTAEEASGGEEDEESEGREDGEDTADELDDSSGDVNDSDRTHSESSGDVDESPTTT